jgi:succinyl-diaminopimelate desuccinylase
VLLAGHLDTVPIAGNVPSKVEGGRLYGCGSSDMKSGVAVQLRIAAALGAPDAGEPSRDITFVFYDCEEVEAARNGLARMATAHPEWLHGDFAVLLEPTDGVIEGGCQGTLKAKIAVPGVRAHSARSWLGRNAIHAAAPLLDRLSAYTPRQVEVEGLTFREGLNAVGISGGVAGNVIPDECVVTVNYRFAPDRSEQEAAAHVREVFGGYEVEITDSAPGARPGLDHPAAAPLLAAVAGAPRAKFGWTDVARFALLGMPALNYGPGDPMLAHSPDEHVPVAQIAECEATMAAWLC